jgi:formylglycine-generating enzyme required for sulfatase activity
VNRTSMWQQTIVLCACTLIWTACAEAASSSKKYTETITAKSGKKISFDMVLVPGGTFRMGSPDTETDRQDHEGPQFQVKLDPYYLCTTETTIALFKAYYEETVTAKKEFISVNRVKKTTKAPSKTELDAVTGPTPVYGDMTMGYSEKHPALGMTWHNATRFCQWLSEKTGKSYRLPTEAEWEYACRAGTPHVYGVTGDEGELTDYAWFEENADDEIHAVGEKKSNAWGFYDMLGNVNEWVFDFYSERAYTKTATNSPVTNPQGPKAGKVHVARGGAFEATAAELRCAFRNFEEDWWRFGDPQIPKSKWWLPELDIIGVRVACTPGN